MSARKMIGAVVVVILVLMSSVLGATTYYVDANDGNDANDGSSWEEAFATIQKGIDTADDGNVVEVNEGTYEEAIDFNGVSCTVRSTNPWDWDVVAATVIDGNGAGNTVTFDSNEDANSVLVGLTVTGAGSSGIYCSASSPTISNCIVTENTYLGINSDSGASPTIENNIIRNHSYYGICSYAASEVVRNNIIYDCDRGIHMYGTGGARTITNCTIVNNTTDGIKKSGSGSATISNCIVWNNSDDLNGCSATYSCIEDGDGGTGNIGSYPYFADYDGNDFHLTWNSPCINRGDPNGTYTGQNDIDGDGRITDGAADVGADEKFNGVSLVANPGFELGGGGWDSGGDPDENVPLYWQDKWPSTSKLIDSDVNHSGDYSWKFTNSGSAYSGAYSDFIEVDNDNVYELSGWVKADGDDVRIIFLWEEFDFNEQSLARYSYVLDDVTDTMDWTRFSAKRRVLDADTAYIRLRFFGPYVSSGTVWWDDFSLVDHGRRFLSAYSDVNEVNLAATVKFGSDGMNEDWVVGTITDYMSDPCTDANDENISYRKFLKPSLIPGTADALEIEFPVFDVDANGLPNGPMLLEIMYKDTIDNEYTTSALLARDLIYVYSQVGWISPDPCYLIDDPNNQWYPLINFGGSNDGDWKYMQFGFQKSDLQLIRAVDDKFRIKIVNLTDTASPSYDVPIDYVTLRKISEDEYQELYEWQRDLRFKEVDLADKSEETSYDDPNFFVFVRDVMHPVYKYTIPADDEPNSINTFTCWSEVEPVSFSIYSQDGVEDVSISVSDLAHVSDGNSTISSSDISLWQILHDEARLGYAVGIGTKFHMGYALVPDRLVSFSGTLSVEPNTCETVWLKIKVPSEDASLPAGVYKGDITLERSGEPNETIALGLKVHDVTLDAPDHLNTVYHDPFRWSVERYVSYSEDINVTFDAYVETEFDAYYHSPQYQIKVIQDANQTYGFVLDTNQFETGLDRMIDEGFAGDNVSLYIASTVWNSVYKWSAGDGNSSGGTDFWADLSDPCFCAAFGKVIDRYCKIAEGNDVNFIFLVADEPGTDPYRRILCDRLYSIMKDPNCVDDVNTIETSVTYYLTCDEWCDSGDYIIPTDNGKIPPLTDLVDYKVWAPSSIGTGYERHQDQDYHGYMSYYTTGASHYRNPVYNRFWHGLFAHVTGSHMVSAYAMGDHIGDPFNDFDSSISEIYPFTYPDFLFAYPTWRGELLYTIGGLEVMREGIKDGRYIATLKNLIADDPNNASSQRVEKYLDELKDSIEQSYYYYYSQGTEKGYYEAIVAEVSESNDVNDYEAFTGIRSDFADFIDLLTDGNDYACWNEDQDKYYSTINAGIDDANNGETLYVSKGTHSETVDFDGKAITLRSFDPNDWDVVEATVIQRSGSGNVVTFNSYEGQGSKLIGLMIRNGTNGIYSNLSGPWIEKCIIEDCTTGVNAYQAVAYVSCCEIRDNSGSGIYGNYATVDVNNSVIHHNAKGIKYQYASGDVANNTIVSNTNYGVETVGTLTVTNCILWDNGDDLSAGCSATYSCIEDNDAGTGNICGDANDPCFVDADGNDFHIDIHSPCVDAGDPCGNYDGQFDIDGEARVLNSLVDMGADEAVLPDAHWWKFDEGSGTTAEDYIGDANGTLVGDANWTTGVFDDAVTLDGSGDYVSVSSLNGAYDSDDTFSVAGWFTTEQSTGKQTIVGQWLQVNPYMSVMSYFGWQVLVEDGDVKARFANGGSSVTDIAGPTDINDPNWHHFALVYATSTDVTLYVDGTAYEGTGTYSSSGGVFRIGDGSFVPTGSPVMKGGPFNGDIDDVMLFERALSAEEVEQLWNAGQ